MFALAAVAAECVVLNIQTQSHVETSWLATVGGVFITCEE